MIGSLVDVQTFDGIKLHGMLCNADPDRRTVWIIVHGVNGNFYGSTLLLDLARCVQSGHQDALLINTRGHDLATFGSADYPARMGSMFETVSDGMIDLATWIRFCKDAGYKNIGCIAHSLGAVKVAYALAHRDVSDQPDPSTNPMPDQESLADLGHFIAISPPRLNTELLLNDSAKREVFDQQLQEAKQWCDKGFHHHIMRVRFPLANWVSAETYLDKYGSGDKYDYFAFCTKIAIPTLWLFGQQEVRQGSVNFRDVDLQMLKTIENRGLKNQQLSVIPEADHSYRGVRDQLAESVSQWIRSSRLGSQT